MFKMRRRGHSTAQSQSMYLPLCVWVFSDLALPPGGAIIKSSARYSCPPSTPSEEPLLIFFLLSLVFGVCLLTESSSFSSLCPDPNKGQPRSPARAPHPAQIREWGGAEVGTINLILILGIGKTVVTTHFCHIHHKGNIFIFDLLYSSACLNCGNWERKKQHNLFTFSYTEQNRLIFSHYKFGWHYWAYCFGEAQGKAYLEWITFDEKPMNLKFWFQVQGL